MSWWHLSISGISQLLLTRFLPNFLDPNVKGRFMGQSSTDANCYDDICPGNIYHGNICPYQQYLSYYWTDFDQTLWTQFFGCLYFYRPHFFNQTIFTQIFFGTKIFFYLNFFWTNICWTKNSRHLQRGEGIKNCV